MTTNTTRTTALEVDGRTVYAGEGAARQEGSLKVYRCNTCGGEVVWATSSRTGRKYLVEVSRGYNDQRFYAKRNAHDCSGRVARREANVRFEQAQARYMEAFHAVQAGRKAGTLAGAELDARLDEMDTLADEVEAARTVLEAAS